MSRRTEIKLKDNVENSKGFRRVILESLPDILEGINIVRKPDGRPVFQSLVAGEIEGEDSEVLWIDSGNESSTYALERDGNGEILEKVSIGRAFTPFQHHKAVMEIEEFLDERTVLAVLPNITDLYINGQLSDWEAEELFQEVWKKLLDVQKRQNLKILTSLSGGDNYLDYMVEAESDNIIEVKSTEEGLKYSSNDFEQLGYRKKGFMQTTIPYWSFKKSGTNKNKLKIV